jgi:hypothetical protein
VLSSLKWVAWVAATSLVLTLVATPVTADDAGQAAARIAVERHGGRVLKVERREDVYRVKLLQSSGKVKIVLIPAAAAGAGDSGRSERGKGSPDGKEH